MRRFLSPASPEAALTALSDALDQVDIGILLLNRDLRVCFINRRLEEMMDVNLELLTTAPTMRELVELAATKGWYGVPAADLTTYLDSREAAVSSGSVPPVLLELPDRRQILVQCVGCPDGGRILTYTDISREIGYAASEAELRVSAESRFNSEILEEQGARLAMLAEAAEANAFQAETARRSLEVEIAERRQLENELRRLATTDGLTGALNRAELLSLAQHALERGRIGGQKLAALMLDVDHFKTINDRFGHAGGDRALVQLVDILRAAIREIDLVGRLGGEEFAIVLPNTTAAAAYRVAERLRARIADTPVVFEGQIIPMTVSIGLAEQLAADRSVETVMSRADQALYRAKESGRNRVVTALSAVGDPV
jgi:diguanylate cyclase (GGDEF)-like protein